MQKENQDKNSQAPTVHFSQVADTMPLEPLKIAWRKSLTAPQDDMWESFIDQADHWAIHFNNQTVGYACVNKNNRLLQFFVVPQWLPEGTLVFEQFIHQLNIKEAIIGTNNPLCLSVAMHFQESIQIEGYLFADFLPAKVSEKEGTVSLAKIEQLEKLVEFCQQGSGGPSEWLNGYLGNLINKGELFVFEYEGETLGTFEVRTSDSNPNVANIGMIVSPRHRKQGLGTFLLGKAKETALAWGKQPICGCDKDNTGSLKCIHNNGFRSIHQMLRLKFSVN